jgi:hypothetical protein
VTGGGGGRAARGLRVWTSEPGWLAMERELGGEGRSGHRRRGSVTEREEPCP